MPTLRLEHVHVCVTTHVYWRMILQYIYRIALIFHKSKFSRIAALKEFVE